MRPDHLDGPLPAHRRGTLSGMDAAPEPTGTYLRRVPRWWAGKGALQQTRSVEVGRARAMQPIHRPACCLMATEALSAAIK
ncbi:hypothetical protein XbrCFBP1976_04700 [Xanthomonas bromi]|uniref:Uncharacterized protein n=1 Tax=Xanthomonas bromi TaxID=56449 RepID=A0ABX5BSW0_9XANT|nr:hypothetical protein XbrCFBP1976_04700 [Xanthomonas bromi]